MSNPVQVDSKVIFRSVAVSDQHRAEFSESVSGEGVPSPVKGLQQMMTKVSQALKDVARELRVLKDTLKPGADRDQPLNNNMNNNIYHDQPQQDDVHGNWDQHNHYRATCDQNVDEESPYGINDDGRRNRRSTVQRFGTVKLPSFDGKEDWSTWITRFEVMASRYEWSEEEKLYQLLPKLEGPAAQFVFSQLAPNVLNNYRELLHEMNCRIRLIETPHSFAAKFSRRTQRPNETVEDFAADLKKLYEKAHGYWDRRTCDEDLVRRFLDGLHDDDNRFEVEYHKDPRNIDEAVYHAVCMIQCRSASRPNKRASNTRRAVSQGSDHRSDQSFSTSEGNGEPSNLEVLQAVKQLTKRVQKLEEKRSSHQKKGSGKETK